MKNSQGTTFDKLSSKESHSLFDKFVKYWNKGKLDKIFYDGGIDEQQSANSFTSHKWSFVKKLNDKDANILASAKDSVHVATNKAAAETSSNRVGEKRSAYASSVSGSEANLGLMNSNNDSSKADAVWKSLGLEPGKRVQIAPRSD